MPRKKFPDTDEDRLIALRSAIDQEELCNLNDMSIPLQLLYEAKNFLLIFEGAGFSYKQALEDQGKIETHYMERLDLARLYISHFIQVLNLAVIRNEIKKENKSSYCLDPENQEEVPNLSDAESILDWGEKIIQGENERTKKGGVPIYNPAIAKVKVHCDMFREICHKFKICSQNTERTGEVLADLRVKADELINNIWEYVEDKYKSYSPDEQMKKFDKYHIAFHYQKGEQLNVFR